MRTLLGFPLIAYDPAASQWNRPMDADARKFLDDLAEQGGPTWPELGVGPAREVFASLGVLFEEGPEVAVVEDRTVAGVPCRAYVPEGAAGTLVYFHGGGWVLGDVGTHDAMCRRLADAGRFAVVSVDYRRPPEEPFPAALDDCVAVTRAVFGNGAGELPVGRVAVGGDSAGGNLAAGVRVATGGRFDVAGLALLYPVLDASMGTESYREFADGYGLTAGAMAWFWENYVGSGGREDPRANVAAADVSDFPPTLVTTCGYDVLRDEGRAFAGRLTEAGRPVEHVEHADQIHGFMHFTGAVPAGRAAVADVAGRVRRMLDG